MRKSRPKTGGGSDLRRDCFLLRHTIPGCSRRGCGCRFRVLPARGPSVRNLYVDRLRGLASLGVVLSHASGYGFISILIYVLPQEVLTAIAANAYHAVALFFVISGFLITTKLLDDRAETLFSSLRKFYRDRVARIAPCLALMLVAALTLAAIGIRAFAVEWSEIPSVLWSVFTFRYNHFLISSTAMPMPRLWDVLWSLSIEEVFYLAFPAFLLLFSRRLLLAFLAALVIYGPIHRSSPGSNFYNYFSNFDLLAIGALTALAAHRARRLNIGRVVLRLCRWGGISIILMTAWFTEDAFKAFVWRPEFIGLGAAIYLFGSIEQNRPREFVVFKVPQLFGRLSYEVYLFHMFFLVAVGHTGLLAIRTTANADLFDASIFIGYFLLLAGLSIAISKFYSEPMNRLIKAPPATSSIAYAPG
jgi:peptidoglycan/LPS O-acetylase OafA/YrhL